MFAVIKTGGKQYKVAKDDVVRVERLDGEAGDVVLLDQVLMVSREGDALDVGAPLVSGARVSAEVVKQTRGDKIIVFKKKRRQKYRRTQGHRQDLTELKILEILAAGQEPNAAPKKAKAEKPAQAKTEAAPAATDDGAVEPVEPRLLKAAEGEADDLSKISGVGPKLVEKLNELGVYHFSQIAAWTPGNIEWLDAHLKFKGRVERDDWIGQAKALADQ